MHTWHHLPRWSSFSPPLLAKLGGLLGLDITSMRKRKVVDSVGVVRSEGMHKSYGKVESCDQSCDPYDHSAKQQRDAR